MPYIKVLSREAEAISGQLAEVPFSYEVDGMMAEVFDIGQTDRKAS